MVHSLQITIHPILDNFCHSGTVDRDIVFLEAFWIGDAGFARVCVISRGRASNQRHTRILYSDSQYVRVVPDGKMGHSKSPCSPLVIVGETSRIEYLNHGRCTGGWHED